jgi:very-short-patch-repair endonuclease
VSLGDARGMIGRVDFVFDDARLIVELDGRRFHEPRAVASEDLQRDLRLTAMGWRVVRLDWWQLVRGGNEIARDLAGVLLPAA